MSDWDDIFEDEARKRAKESDEFLSRPEIKARQERARAARQATFERDYAAGLCDENGDYYAEDEDEDEDEEDE